MKSLYNIIILLIIIVSFSNCTTPKHLVVPNRPFSTANKIRNVNISEFRIDPLTKEDDINDIEKLADVFSDYMKLNNSYYQIQERYPDASLKINIEPKKTIKRTWILDAAFFYPGCGMWPLSPRWGETTINITLAVNIPSIDYAPYNFSASNKYIIYWYPYYYAGKILTNKFALTYNDIFTQISEYNFIENWTGNRKITALLESDQKTILSEQLKDEENKSRTTVIVPEQFSDIDQNIPLNHISRPNTYALIIGNEDYSSYQLDLSSEVNVDFAEHDARIFKDYAISTLGAPEQNVTLLINGTSGQMHQALAKINLICKNSKGEANIIFYYAGHGLPDEVSREPHLMPVDISAKNLSQAIKLTDIYNTLTEFPSRRVTVFLDACFSGGARNQGLLSARTAKVKPKEEQLEGNLVVFTASSGEESSLPYREKYHGMFTYFLLKKFKESKGNLTYKELSDYLSDQVALQSVIINSKEQNTQTNVSSGVVDIWETWNFLDQ